ncbi:hypothetical protein SAMN06265365_11433 [Tistlia consotensis]|uniref:Uncharacterized protein n=1 Tax=Tistlia consotensis USBA 355 TaxID=560819 RepID=A0A1Y6BAW8_9PROT|nr:hypothetical protein [Tistlia consotensis]SMF00254.1 hypothetical protein SAMN05428998_102330 [Tistlia consotensis USBA 355]SNR76091.1 hypothetical protein SAMN06265365_11433 [Tistlia consotensis]
MMSIWSLFGPSRERQRLDLALRRYGVHPQLLADPVKLTVLRLIGRHPAEAAIERAAVLIAYCLLGPEDFVEANPPGLAAEQEQRLGLALEAPQGEDARLVMLCLRSGLAESSIEARFELEDVP